MPVIAFDATPLTPYPGAYGGHAVRGIGRYLTSILRSLGTTRPDWVAERLAVVHTRDVALPWWSGRSIVTRRLRVRPQDVGWLSAPVSDALAVRGTDVWAWTTTDPAAPLKPPGTGRSIVVAYDLIPLSLPGGLAHMRPHRRLVYRLYLRRLQRADVVIAISRTVAAQLTARLGVAADRITVVYPGLEVPAAGRDVATGTARDLLFVGVPAAHKRPEAALTMLAELVRRGHDLRLRFVGTDFPAARRTLGQAAQIAGVSDRVEHLGQVGDARLTELYRASTLVAPSIVEGLGLAPIEALLAGGRAVCGSAPVFRETCGELVSYADPGDSASLADAYEHELARAAPSPAQRAALADQFGAERCASAAVAAFERLRSSPAT